MHHKVTSSYRATPEKRLDDHQAGQFVTKDGDFYRVTEITHDPAGLWGVPFNGENDPYLTPCDLVKAVSPGTTITIVVGGEVSVESRFPYVPAPGFDHGSPEHKAAVKDSQESLKQHIDGGELFPMDARARAADLPKWQDTGTTWKGCRLFLETTDKLLCEEWRVNFHDWVEWKYPYAKPPQTDAEFLDSLRGNVYHALSSGSVKLYYSIESGHPISVKLCGFNYVSQATSVDTFAAAVQWLREKVDG